MLGVSTSFRSEISNSGIEVINAVLDLGVEAVELEYRITPPMLARNFASLPKEADHRNQFA